MTDQWFSCKACSSSDPTQDTVKVDISMLLPNKDGVKQNSRLESLLNKENAQPNKENMQPNRDNGLRENDAKKPMLSPNNFTVGQLVFVLRSNGAWSRGAVAESSLAMLTVVLQEGGQKQIPAELIPENVRPLTEKEQKEAEEQLKRQKEEKEAEEKRLHLEKERLRWEAEDKARHAAQEKARQEQREKEEHAAAAAAAAAAATAEAEERSRQEAAQREVEEQERQVELAAAQEKVQAWCKKNGFSKLSNPKKTMRGASKYPLHTAVKHQNDEMVQLLLKCGADQNAVDSKKQTPQQLAAKMNRNGSHDQIISMLS